MGWVMLSFRLCFPSSFFLLISYTTALQHKRDCASLLPASPVFSLSHTHQTLHASLWLGDLCPFCFFFLFIAMKRSIGTTTRYEICICWFVKAGTIQRALIVWDTLRLDMVLFSFLLNFFFFLLCFRYQSRRGLASCLSLCGDYGIFVITAVAQLSFPLLFSILFFSRAFWRNYTLYPCT
ncbi:hypothetical protein V8C35DRAFT_129223 [Trichoderma chlorosporum]